jgi:predicted site-specific integrase-resolvase
MTKLENDDLRNNLNTLHELLTEIKDVYDLFGILIQYNRKRQSVLYMRIEDPSVRMIEAFSIHQALKEGNKLSSIYLEKVTGTHLINGILYAIQIVF